MKINSVRAMLIISLAIILLYILGLFLPIIKNTKTSKVYYYNHIAKVYYYNHIESMIL